MTKEQIGRHACVAIVLSSDKRQFLLSRYDDGYPIKIMFRGWGNLTGGANNKKNDSIKSSPESLVRREISEEYSIVQAEHDKELPRLSDVTLEDVVEHNSMNFAPESDVRSIRESILENLIPYQDFLVRIPGDLFRHGKNNQPYQNIFSAFLSEVPDNILVIAKRNLDAGKRLVNEGIAHLAPIEELEKGFPLLAWAASPILIHYTKKELPNLINADATPFGLPRQSFESYFGDFEYEPGFFKEF